MVNVPLRHQKASSNGAQVVGIGGWPFAQRWQPLNPAGTDCRFTGPPQNPNTATFLISQGSRAAAPQHDPPPQSQHPGGATAHSERKSSARGGHPSAALHTGLGRRSKPKPGVILTQRQSANRQPGQQLGPPHSRENRGKKRRRGWGNISDAAGIRAWSAPLARPQFIHAVGQ